MGLAETQSFLARLWTDASLRESFFAAPLSVGVAAGLTPVESEELARLAQPQVAFFARTLQSKRAHEVRDLLPRTSRVLGERFGPLFRRYAETSNLSGLRKHRADALGFAAYIASVQRAERIEAWIIELLRYEAAWLLSSEPYARFIVRAFSIAVDGLARDIGSGAQTTQPRQRPTFMLWLRLTRRGRLRHLVISLPSLRIKRVAA